jgi:hypothetical protein
LSVKKRWSEKGKGDLMKITIKSFLAGFVMCVCIQGLGAMGDQQTMGGRQSGKIPVHIKPKANTEKFIADIRDESTTTRVQWLTFSGDQKIGGLCQENKDSTDAIDLVKVKKIKVLNRFYATPRYPNKVWTQVEITFLSGKNTYKDVYLFPEDIVICGEEIDPKCADGPTECPKGDKAWHLSTIDYVEILDDPAAPQAVQKESVKEPVKATEKKTLQETPSSELIDSLSTTVTTTVSSERPVEEKKQYKEMELKLVDKEDDKFKEKTILGAAQDIVGAVIAFIKAVLETVKRWLW